MNNSNCSKECNGDNFDKCTECSDDKNRKAVNIGYCYCKDGYYDVADNEEC